MSDVRTLGPGALPGGTCQPGQHPGPRQAEAAPAADQIMFMRNRIVCDACRMLRSSGLLPAADTLHVLLRGEHIVVTAIEDLHEPGPSISGQRVADLPHASVFRLTAAQAPGIAIPRHQPAAGVAVLSWTGQKRRLVLAGVAEGVACEHDQMFDAIEE